MARWRLQNKFSILPISSDFLAMKCFKIPISLSKLNLILPNLAHFAFKHPKCDIIEGFSNTVKVKGRESSSRKLCTTIGFIGFWLLCQQSFDDGSQFSLDSSVTQKAN